jgi:hypothetical protein
MKTSGIILLTVLLFISDAQSQSNLEWKVLSHSPIVQQWIPSKNLASGVYFYQVQTEYGAITKEMLYLK